MLRLASEEYPFIEVDETEKEMALEHAYSYLVLAELKKKFAGDELTYLIGSDSLMKFTEWRNPDKVAALIPILAVPRGEAREEAEAEAKAIQMKLEAEAEGKKRSLLAEAEGFEAMVRAAESNPAADRFCAMMKKTRRSVCDTHDTQGVSWSACREPLTIRMIWMRAGRPPSGCLMRHRVRQVR